MHPVLERGEQGPVLPVAEARRGAGVDAVDVAAVGEEAAAAAEGELGQGVEGPEADPLVQGDDAGRLPRVWRRRRLALFVETLDEEVEGLVHLVLLLEPGGLGEAGGDLRLDHAHAGFVADGDEGGNFFALGVCDHWLVGMSLLV